MSNIKTTVSMNKTLFDEMEALAQEMGVSRSQIFSLAAKEYIQRRKIMKVINAAYADEPDANDEALQKRMRRKQRIIVEG